jgi:hypothetical protein
MSRIDRSQPPTGPLERKAAATGPIAPEAVAKRANDAINISVDARVRLNKENKPEVVLDGVVVDGVDAKAQAEVEKNMKGRRPGLRQQVTQAVVEQIAAQVAQAIAPTLEQKLEEALVAEHLPAGLADDLARQTIPELAKIVAAKIAENAKVSYKVGF